MSPQAPNFPFTAVSGQAQFKLALILAAIDPGIGGVLVSGPRGSAKSTLARGLADLLPGEQAFVNLPLGASEEMLVGTLDLQKVLDQQKVEFNPGLLAKAHGGVLYVDEVNLLADNLVDLLLDVAASGINSIERDGISHSHAAEFILLGTMNPDEGELRPQLLDRFGLAVEIDNHYRLEDRVTIVRLREAFDKGPQQFVDQYRQQQQQIAEAIQTAVSLVNGVNCAEKLRVEIAQRCQAANVDGLRADIVWYRAAVAHAAWSKRSEVNIEDIDAVEALVLCHRREDDQSSPTPPSSKSFKRPAETQSSQSGMGDWGSMKLVQQESDSGSLFELLTKADATKKNGHGLLDLFTRSTGQSTRGSKNTTLPGHKPDWFATLVNCLGSWPPQNLIMQKTRRSEAVLHLVMLDTSASTIKHRQFAKAKAAILKIADQAYLQRHQITILGFGNQAVETLLTRKRAPKALKKLLDNVRAGGGTPLREVVEQAYQYQAQLIKQMPDLKIRNYLLTDGKTSQPLSGLRLIGETTLIDIEQSAVKRGKSRQLAQILGAHYLPLPV